MKVKLACRKCDNTGTVYVPFFICQETPCILDGEFSFHDIETGEVSKGDGLNLVVLGPPESYPPYWQTQGIICDLCEVDAVYNRSLVR